MPHMLSFALLVGISTAAADVRPLALVPLGESRELPERILGASAEPFWENFLKDPAKVAALKSMHLGYTRFPGGSQSNYYDWKKGMFFVPAGEKDSGYYELFVKLAASTARRFPQGISLESYKAFSDGIGATMIMVPNLETASVDDQVEWFKQLSASAAVPTHIELGNEFWAAMGQDPVVMKRWPDEPTSARITRGYIDAFRRYLPKGVKVAWQAGAPSFRGETPSRGPMMERLRKWNADLKPAPWFAVEAALFRGKGHATLILQNVSEETRLCRLGHDLKLGKPAHVEQLTAPDLTDEEVHAAAPETVAPAFQIKVPPYSLTRVIWNSP